LETRRIAQLLYSFAGYAKTVILNRPEVADDTMFITSDDKMVYIDKEMVCDNEGGKSSGADILKC
jgi:hypothetical protein